MASPIPPRQLGDGRRIRARSVDLKQTVCSGGRQAVVRSVDLKQNVCISSENADVQVSARLLSQNACIYDGIRFSVEIYVGIIEICRLL